MTRWDRFAVPISTGTATHPEGQTRPGELHAGKESPVPPVGRAPGSCVTTWHTPIPGARKCLRRRSGDVSEKMPQVDAPGGAEPPPRTARTGSPCPLSQLRLENRLQPRWNKGVSVCLPSHRPGARPVPAQPGRLRVLGGPCALERPGVQAGAAAPTRSCWLATSEQP